MANSNSSYRIVLFTDRVVSEGHDSLESAAEAWLELRAGNRVNDDLSYVRDREGAKVGEIVEVGGLN